MSGAYAIAAPYRGEVGRGFQDVARAPQAPRSVNAPGVNRLGGFEGNAFRRAYQDILGRSVASPMAGRMALQLAGRVAARAIPVVGWALLAYDIYQLAEYLTPQVPAKNGYIDWLASMPGGTVGHAHCDFCAVNTPTQWRRDDVLQYGPGTPYCIQGCTDFQVPGGSFTDGVPVVWTKTVSGPFYWHAISISTGPSQLSGTRMRIESEDVFMEAYPGTVAADITVTATMHAPRPIAIGPPPLAYPYTAVMPESSPIHGIPPFPVAIPYKAIPHVRPSPYLPASVQRQVSYGPLSEVIPGYGVGPKAKPYERPARKQVIWPPLVGPRLQPAYQGLHSMTRTPPGTKEKKFMLSLDGKTPVGIVVNTVSEAGDLIDSIYDALPASRQDAQAVNFRSGGGLVRTYQAGDHLTDMSRKLGAIFRSFDKVDWRGAIGNLIWNEVEDGFYGIMGKGMQAGASSAGINPAVLRRAGGVDTRGPGITRPDWWTTATPETPEQPKGRGLPQ